MTVEIKAPTFPESVADGVVAAWHKQPGEAVARDELLVEIETDKVALEVPATADGVITELLVSAGDTVNPGTVIARISAGETVAKQARVTEGAPTTQTPAETGQSASGQEDRPVSPSVRRVASEGGVNPADIPGTGRDGRASSTVRRPSRDRAVPGPPRPA